MNFDITSAVIGVLTGVILGFLLKLKSLQELSVKIQKIGLTLGVKGFEEQVEGGSSSVKTGKIGKGFKGKIAGRDINETLNDIKESVDKSSRQIGEYIDKSLTIWIDSE